MRPRLHRAALGLLLLALGGCDAPTIPRRADAYPFTLPTSTGELVLRWPVGSTIQVAPVPGGAAAAAIRSALESGAAAWNAAALYGEFNLSVVTDAAQADVLVAGSDAVLPVDVADCPPSGPGLGLTTFCLTADQRGLETFPASPGGGGHVRMVVTVLASYAADPAAARRVVAHELGHVLGIERHAADPADLMASPPATDRPAAADIATVLALYHTPADVVP